MPLITEDALKAVRDRASLFGFLGQFLGWDTDADDPFVYETEAGTERVRVSRIVPFGERDPFALILAEFQSDFRRTDLRRILTTIRRDDRVSRRFGGRSPEEIIFLCPTRDYAGVTFAHFEERANRPARLQAFGWERAFVRETRTLRLVNLPLLTLPGRNDLEDYDWNVVRPRWLKAWDVKPITGDFFRDYRQVYEDITGLVSGVPGGDTGLFTRRLLNRLLFLQFLSKRGWLRFGEQRREDYLYALWEGRDRTASSFYNAHLRPLFFAGLNNPQSRHIARDNPALHRQIGDVPFLNGGLFTPEPEDEGGDRLAVVPDAAMEKILDLFTQYNFTVTESTPDDVQVAIDPEMLGEVFERLATQDERKSTGSYYTPRVVVQFMCREALKGHLHGPETGVARATVDAVVERDRAVIEHLPQHEAVALLQRLSGVRVVDPACGSGAYLLGMLHELFDLIGLLEVRANPLSEDDKYARKLDIISKNLYGVDLQAMAVETARLRLWLSLVVEDDRKPLDEDCNVALPNLDFKIERGDSLSAPAPQGGPLPDMFRQQAITDFQRKKARFLRAQGPDKERLLAEITPLRESIRQGLHTGQTVDGFDWAVEFAEVFHPEPPLADVGGAMNLGGTLAEAAPPGGFDIVLANPPYGATVADAVRNRYFDPADSAQRGQSKDTYGLFVARALQILRPGGQFCYIISDTWRTIKSHKPLRRRLLETTTVRHVLDLPAWIFDATVNTCILTLSQARPAEGHCLVAGDLRNIPVQDWPTLTRNLGAAAAHGPDVQTAEYARYTYPQSLIGTYDNASFFIGSPKLYAMMSDKNLTRLGDIGRAPHGISTGDNHKYVRTEPDVRGTLPIIEEWMKMPPEERQHLTDTEKTSGVDKDWTALRGCFVPFEKGGEAGADGGWLPNYYVPTQYYINWAKGAIADMRRNLGAAWKNQQFFFRPGLTFSISGIYAPTFRMNSAAVFEAKGSGIFCDAVPPEVLLALLCSRFAKYQFKNYIKHSVDTSGDDIEQFRFPLPDPEVAQQQLSALVSAIIDKQKANLRYPYHLHEQTQIDALVYELYGLDAGDIREVELWYCRRYPRLARAQGLWQDVHARHADFLTHAAYILSRHAAYWNSHPLLARIARGEGAHLEFKQTLEWDTRQSQRNPALVQSALKTIAAFANTEGGTLLIGVTDRGGIAGLSPDYAQLGAAHRDADGFEQKLRSLFQTRLSPNPHGHITIHVHTLAEGEVCEVAVTPVPPAQSVYLDTSDFYIRDGNGSRKIQGPALTQWLQRPAPA